MEQEAIAKKKKSRVPKIIGNVLFGLLIAVFLAVIVTVSTLSMCFVDGHSMEDTLQDTQYVLLFKWGYKAKRGDIVAIYSDENAKIPLIKRVIGVDGDRLVFMENRRNKFKVDLYRDIGDGFQLLEEDYIKNGSMGSAVFGEENMFASGEYKIAPYGDIGSVDSAYIIDVDDGLFVLGDNRDDSYDSRHYGVLGKKLLKGKMFCELKPGSFWEKIFLLIY